MPIEIPCVNAGGEVMTPEAAAQAAASIEAAVAAEGPLSPEQLDTLFGPVALFPDPVLTPLLVAVTFPLDVVKAGRFVEASAGLPDRERAADAAAQTWDASVRDLAAAFPDLVTRMSDHIDWTEQAGEAVLAQTDDVLGSIQRLRATAQENGYLVDNEAQDVQTEGDTIVIAPADPQVVYVPTYDSQVVYTTPITSPPAYYYEDDNYEWTDALVTGGIILGGAVILDEIFDDDDWDGWDDWDDDADIDWDGGDIKIDRGDINIDGDVNIGGGDRVNVGDGDRVSIGDGNRPGIGDGDRPGIGAGDRPVDGDRVSIGDLDRPAIGDGGRAPGGVRPAISDRTPVSNPASRDVARQKIESRQTSGAGVATLPATRRPDAARPAASRPAAARPAGASRPATTRSAPISKPKASRAPTARAPSKSNVFKSSSGSRAKASSNRGRASSGGRSGGGRR